MAAGQFDGHGSTHRGSDHAQWFVDPLVQQGLQNRGVTRCYLANLFPGQGRFAPLAPRSEGRRSPTSGPGPAPMHRPRAAA